MTKQIHTLMRGIMMFMLFMEACACSVPACGLVALEIFMEAQDRKAEMNGMRNRPKAGSQTWTSLQSVLNMKFHFGWSPRLRPRKLKSISSSPSSLPGSAAWS